MGLRLFPAQASPHAHLAPSGATTPTAAVCPNIEPPSTSPPIFKGDNGHGSYGVARENPFIAKNHPKPQLRDSPEADSSYPPEWRAGLAQLVEQLICNQ